MNRLARRGLPAWTMLVSICCSWVAPASAQESAPPNDTVKTCVAAHRRAQELRQANKLLESREQLLICSEQSCPGALISDCWALLERLQPAIPSLVFELKRDGSDAPDAAVFVDGPA